MIERLKKHLSAINFPDTVLSIAPLNSESGASFCITLLNKARFLAKLKDDKQLLLGADRNNEAIISSVCSELNFLPTLFYQDQHLNVFHWIEGQAIVQWTPHYLAIAAEKLAQVHQYSHYRFKDLTNIPQLDLNEQIFMLLSSSPEDQQGEWLMRLSQMNEQPDLGDNLVLVHNDAHLDNWLVDTSGELRLLDWEYACWATPEVELAGFIVSNSLAEFDSYYFIQQYQRYLNVDKSVVMALIPWIQLLSDLWYAIKAEHSR